MSYKRSAGGVLMPDALSIGGQFTGQIVRGGEVVDEWTDHNIVVNEGLNHILDTVFHGSTPVTTWYLGLFEGNYTPVATLTAATVAAAATESTAYAETTRPEYVEAAASGQSVTNAASKATFTINAAKTIYGAFLISGSAKSGTAGVLMSAARFSAAKTVAAEDQLLLTYTFNAATA